jgi:hypothetical protein
MPYFDVPKNALFLDLCDRQEDVACCLTVSQIILIQSMPIFLHQMFQDISIPNIAAFPSIVLWCVTLALSGRVHVGSQEVNRLCLGVVIQLLEEVGVNEMLLDSLQASNWCTAEVAEPNVGVAAVVGCRVAEAVDLGAADLDADEVGMLERWEVLLHVLWVKHLSCGKLWVFAMGGDVH